MTRNFHRSDDKHKEIDKQTSIGRAVVVLGVAVIVTSPLTTNETWTAFGKSELLVFCEGRRLDV